MRWEELGEKVHNVLAAAVAAVDDPENRGGTTAALKKALADLGAEFEPEPAVPKVWPDNKPVGSGSAPGWLHNEHAVNIVRENLVRVLTKINNSVEFFNSTMSVDVRHNPLRQGVDTVYSCDRRPILRVSESFGEVDMEELI